MLQSISASAESMKARGAKINSIQEWKGENYQAALQKLDKIETIKYKLTKVERERFVVKTKN